MKKILLIAIIAFITTIIQPYNIYASYSNNIIGVDELESQLDTVDTSTLEDALVKSNNSTVKGINIKDLLLKAIKGELGITPGSIMQEILKAFFIEITSLLSLMQSMLIIAILSAIFTNISTAFKSRHVSELGFYVNYVIAVALLLSSFKICIEIMTGFVSDICSIMEAAIPVMLSVAAIAGSGVKAYLISPAVFAAAGFIGSVVNSLFVPVIMIAATLETVNYLSEKEILQKFADLIKKILNWGMRITAVLFMGVVSLQGLSAPIMNNAAAKTARFAITAIPVVGGVFASAVDTVFYWSGAVRSGFMIVILIILILMCALPIIKIAAFILIYKATASLIQPICDSRIVRVIDGIGGFASIMLSACAIVAVMFIFMVMIMLSA